MTIKIESKGQEMELSVDEARRILRELASVLGDTTTRMPRFEPSCSTVVTHKGIEIPMQNTTRRNIIQGRAK